MLPRALALVAAVATCAPKEAATRALRRLVVTRKKALRLPGAPAHASDGAAPSRGDQAGLNGTIRCAFG